MKTKKHFALALTLLTSLAAHADSLGERGFPYDDSPIHPDEILGIESAPAPVAHPSELLSLEEVFGDAKVAQVEKHRELSLDEPFHPDDILDSTIPNVGTQKEIDDHRTAQAVVDDAVALVNQMFGTRHKAKYVRVRPVAAAPADQVELAEAQLARHPSLGLPSLLAKNEALPRASSKRDALRRVQFVEGSESIAKAKTKKKTGQENPDTLVSEPSDASNMIALRGERPDLLMSIDESWASVGDESEVMTTGGRISSGAAGR